MKKLLLFSVFAFALTATYGQGLYVKFGGGYAVPMGSQSLLEPTSTVGTQDGNQNQVVTSKTKVVKGSYGAGILINAAVGYKFSPFIGFDLNLTYQLGKEYTGTTSLENTTNGASASIDQKLSSKSFFASPTMMFMAGSERVRPYALVGVIVGSTKLTDESGIIVDFTDIPIVGSTKTETKGDLAFGFRGGVGVDINVSSMFTIYAEGVFNSISYYANESEVVEAIVDGENTLTDATVREIKTVYVDEITTVTIGGNEQINDNEPTQELRSPSPLSSLGVNIGLKIKLGSD